MNPLRECILLSYGFILAFKASNDIAAAISCIFIHLSASWRTIAAKAVRTLLPLINDNPSLASSSSGSSPIFFNAVLESTILPFTNISPSPINANAIWDIGAKSPHAPTEPFSHTTGTIL